MECSTAEHQEAQEVDSEAVFCDFLGGPRGHGHDKIFVVRHAHTPYTRLVPGLLHFALEANNFEDFREFCPIRQNTKKHKTQNNNITPMSLHVLEDGAQSPSYRLLLPNLPLQVQVLKHNKQGAI